MRKKTIKQINIVFYEGEEEILNELLEKDNSSNFIKKLIENYIKNDTSTNNANTINNIEIDIEKDIEKFLTSDKGKELVREICLGDAIDIS